MRGLYNLGESGEPVPVDNLAEWRGLSDPRRLIANSEVGASRVSTVFLGLDHDLSGDGPPVLWETMVFGGRLDGFQERYTSRYDAVAGHDRAVTMALKAG